MTQEVSVAEAKKRFSELLARAAYRGDRFIIEKRGKPVAALIGLDDLSHLEEKKATEKEQPQGLLAAAGVLADYGDFEEVMVEVYRSRSKFLGRRVQLTDVPV